MTDAGSTPAISTKYQNGPDRSRPSQASSNEACGVNPNSNPLVYDGPHWSPVRHNSVTTASQADQLKSFGTRECHDFRQKILSKHFNVQDELISSYIDIAKEKGYIDANRSLLEIDKRLRIADLNLSVDTELLKKFARTKAAECSHFANKHHYSEKAYDLGCDLIRTYDIEPPKPKDFAADTYPCIKRLSCPNWWFRKLRKKQRQAIESVARDIGRVCVQKSAYSSTFAQTARAQQKLLNHQYLESTFIENDEGERYCLKDLHDRSVSNPVIRRAELMTRINGFEMVADQLGHCGEFYTITAPSRMHARLKRGGSNPKYDGTSPDQAHRYICDLFKRIRSKLHRDGKFIYGIRVVEPNHDGTPHWHLLLFMDPAIKSEVREVFQQYALQEDGHEKGAKKHRFKAVEIDNDKGSAAGYVAKYISKNIDGQHIDKDLHGNDAKASAKAIDAWASTYNIRQFQYIGSPSVTVWRELRSLSNSNRAESIDPIKEPVLYKSMLAADAAEWAAFVMLMGGVGIKSSERPIKPLYQKAGQEADPNTGELLTENLTRYGNPKPPKIIGLITCDRTIITKYREWKLVNDPPTRALSPTLARQSRTAETIAEGDLDLCQ
ncbi:replication endonuclease [Neptuniibacter pectenicola]|uniref:Replication endonuclease n=1 Tax=Neptuniibacter pectenicola TaxID=1806669 RepID=A0ABU9TPU2_9GAMM